MFQFHCRFIENAWLLLHDQISFHWSFPQNLSQIHEKFFGKKDCQSYFSYIKNKWVLLLKIQFIFLLKIFKNVGKKNQEKCVVKSVTNFLKQPWFENYGEILSYKPPLEFILINFPKCSSVWNTHGSNLYGNVQWALMGDKTMATTV